MSERPTIERLRELLAYDPETGVLTWRVKPNRRILVGSQAGARRRGYLVIRVDGVLYPAQNLAFAIHHGRWPDRILDHDDQDRGNNRIRNLIEAGYSENNRNFDHSDRTAPYRGIYRAGKGWAASLSVNSKKIYLGCFKTPEDAARAYDEYVVANLGDRFPTNASLGLLK